jgi:hypothetical protein
MEKAEQHIQREDIGVRHKRLQDLYGILVQLVMHEGRFVSERTNSFLLFNSFFFAGFTALLSLPAGNNKTGIFYLELALPAVGLIMSVLHSIIITRNMDAADFWRSSIGLIEDDSDFWYPQPKTKKDMDLDIFTARSRYLKDNPIRQKQHSLRLSHPPGFIKKLSSFLPDPNQIYVYWLPSLIFILWFLALLVVLFSFKPILG